MEEVPSFISRLNPNCEKGITFEQRSELLYFNTVAYWHCYYDEKTNKLYDQYCGLITNNAKEYLARIGLLSEDGQVLETFEHEKV